MIWDLLDVEVPIVCGLNGSAAGLGASVALLCESIVMADTAVIVDPHVRSASWPATAGRRSGRCCSGRWPPSATCMLGDPLTAADAAAARAWPPRSARPPTSRERARPGPPGWPAGAPLAVQGTKQAVNAQLKQALLTSFDVSMALEIPCILSDDHAEAVDAYVAGRPPMFEGR